MAHNIPEIQPTGHVINVVIIGTVASSKILMPVISAYLCSLSHSLLPAKEDPLLSETERCPCTHSIASKKKKNGAATYAVLLLVLCKHAIWPGLIPSRHSWIALHTRKSGTEFFCT